MKYEFTLFEIAKSDTSQHNNAFGNCANWARVAIVYRVIKIIVLDDNLCQWPYISPSL